MIPGVNPRQLKQMMRQMGMSQEDIDAVQVIIKTENKNIIINNPSVQKITMQGQINFQISGEISEEEVALELNISQEDIEMVSSQANVSNQQALMAIKKANGDLAQAIIDLTQ